MYRIARPIPKYIHKQILARFLELFSSLRSLDACLERLACVFEGKVSVDN